MHCFIRQHVVHRTGDVLCRKVKQVGRARRKVELLADFPINSQRNILKFAGVVSLIVTIILLAEHFQGIGSCCKVGRNLHACRAICTVLCDAPVIEDIAAVVCEHSGNIFIFARTRAGVGDSKVFTHPYQCIACRSIETAAGIFQRQFPFCAACANFGQIAVYQHIRFAAFGGRCEEDSVQI